ncbi:MAG: hypothetical protein ACRDL6_11675 [Solirubrobacterales bacterium]
MIAILVGLLVLPAGASAVRAGGHNKPTRQLETAFKVAGRERADDPKGCYPSASRMAKLIRERLKAKAAVVKRLGAVKRRNRIHVIRKGTRCDRITMAVRASKGLYILDSNFGPVRLAGKKGLSRESIVGNRGRLRAVDVVSKSTRTNTNQDVPERLEVFCPGKKFPIGGGMSTNPALAMDGQGTYPHSYERLGVQRGFHITSFFLNAANSPATPRQVTIQAVCAKGLVPTSSPHKTFFVRPGQTKTATARCRRGTKLFSGGFQRSNYLIYGGSYPTESRAIGKKAWRVTGSAFGAFGGELTAVALCSKDRSMPITEVSATTPVTGGRSTTVTTPPCPGGRRLTTGGFDFNGSINAFFAGGAINSDGTWTASGYGHFGPAPAMTAYGYCLKA